MPWPLRMILRISPILFVTGLYVGWRFSKALVDLFDVSVWKVRLAVFLVIGFINLLPLVILTTYQRGRDSAFFLSETQLQTADYAFNFPFWIGLAIVMEAAFYLIALDVAGLIFQIIPSIRPSNWLKWKSMLVVGIVGFFIVYVPIRVYFDTYHVRQETIAVKINNLPKVFEDLRLTFISDVQVDRYTQQVKLDRLNETLEKVDSDLLLFGGDLVTSGQQFINQGVNFLGQNTAASLGRIGCMGDHDHWASPHRIATGLKQHGWNFLQNEHQVVDYKGHKILITGITYIYSRRIGDYGLQQLLDNAPEADLKIILVHQPAEVVIDAARKYGYHLVLAGHTHGGQIVYRPFGYPITVTRFENRFYSGYYENDGLPVVVTNGTGLTLAPIRYQAPATVSVLKFVEGN